MPSLRDLPEPADLAFILPPVRRWRACSTTCPRRASSNAVVLAAGYREVGEEGRALEDSLVARAIAHDITVLGPNCLGFVNAQTGPRPTRWACSRRCSPDRWASALQSGALASVVLGFAGRHAIGLSTLTSMGNEAMMKTADFLDYLVEDEATKVICLFLEEIGDPDGFARTAEKADRAGKPIVVLKVGLEPGGPGGRPGPHRLGGRRRRGGQRGVPAAQHHPGGHPGGPADHRGDARLQPLAAGRRMGVLTPSGGACDIIADAASAQGIEIPEFSPRTEEAIAAYLPPFASPRNPLDVTGYGVLANLTGRGIR